MSVWACSSAGQLFFSHLCSCPFLYFLLSHTYNATCQHICWHVLACVHAFTQTHTHTDMCLDWMFNSSMTSFPANHYYLPQRKSLNRLPIKHIPTAEVKFATEVWMEFLFYFLPYFTVNTTLLILFRSGSSTFRVQREIKLSLPHSLFL